jgi:hypothetical protein
VSKLAELFEVAVLVGAALDRAEVRWALGGGLAVTLHGAPREADAVEVVCELGAASVESVLRELDGAFFVERKAVVAAALDRSMFEVLHPPTMSRVIVTLVRDDALSASQIQRRVFFRAYARDDIFPVLSAEDVVVQALALHRRTRGTAPLAWRDAVGALAACAKTLDRTWLLAQARRGRLQKLLDRAWKEAASSSGRGGAAAPAV